jgi:shikimate kinase
MRTSPASEDDIVLIGMMGTGKTTVGRLLSCRLVRPFVDSDEQIELQTGKTVREIFESDGEPAFRRLESKVLRQALDAPGGPRVITAAGGVVLEESNRAALAQVANVVWLRARPALLSKRVGSADHRPLLADDPLGTLTRLADERDRLYDEVATLVIDVDELEPPAVADRIVAWVGVAPR